MTTEKEQRLAQAFNLFQQKRIGEAELMFESLVAEHPNYYDALHYFGLLKATTGRSHEAKALLERSLATKQNYTAYSENYVTILYQIGEYDQAIAFCSKTLGAIKENETLQYVLSVSLLNSNRLEEAAAAFERLIARFPRNIAAHNERGTVLAKQGHLGQALCSVEKALELKPSYADALLNKGNILAKLNKQEQAIESFNRAIRASPNLHNAYLGLGNAYRIIKSYEEALAAYDRALSLRSDSALSWLGRGNLLRDLKRYDEGFSAYDRALSSDPKLAEAWVGRGNIFFDLRQYDQALVAYDKALLIKEDLASAWLGRGNVFREIKHNDKALAAYDGALSIDPDLAKAWLGRGNVFADLQRYDQALHAYDCAKAGDSALVDTWSAKASILAELNRIDEALASFDQALSIDPSHAHTISNRIFVLDFVTSSGFEGQQRARDYWWDKVGAPLAERWARPHANVRDPYRRLKIGYVSADLKAHSAALSFKPLMLNHNKADFHVTCYSSTIVSDATTREFERAVDQWRDVVQVSDDGLYDLICKDQIDILVDLSGHTAGHRLEVFARKPAPVQISIGATGTGLKTIDYIFADPVICPPAVRHFFAEKIFDLPSIMTIEALPEQLEVAPAPVLSKGYITFGMFNRISKISDEAVVLWARILHAVPRSRLLIKHYALDDASVRARQLERFSAHGIGPDRIDLAGSSPRKDHLAAFKNVDISLDPFPHNGGISTLDSLQMGVPVIALLGNAPTSRAAGSILCSTGLEAWVANTADEYFSIATKFAAMPDHLGQLRYALPSMLVSSAVGNGAIYTKAVELAYRKIWIDYCRNSDR